MFANASPERPGLYLTVVGEPPLKMLRYQQTFDFFDPAKVNGVIRFLSLGDELMRGGLGAVLDKIIRTMGDVNPRLVVVDSFRSVIRATRDADGGELALQDFVHRLAVHLAAWEATTFLIGEHTEAQVQDHPVYTVADGIIVLSQQVERNSVVRKMRVVKVRGRITSAGLTVYPRLPKPEEERSQDDFGAPSVTESARLSTGIGGLDAMLGGGIPRGYSALIAGPSGSGKTVLAAQFLSEGIKHDEPGVLALFEKRPAGYLKTTTLGQHLEEMIRTERLAVVYLRPLDLSVDETLYAIREAVIRTRAKRVVIDSLSGFEMAVSPGFREDFRESLYRLVGVLTGLGVTVMMTLEIEDAYTVLRLGPRENAFLSDAIILQRYVEIDGQLERLISVVKVRASEHSKELRLYDVTPTGIRVSDTKVAYHEVLLGRAMGVPLSRSG